MAHYSGKVRPSISIEVGSQFTCPCMLSSHTHLENKLCVARCQNSEMPETIVRDDSIKQLSIQRNPFTLAVGLDPQTI